MATDPFAAIAEPAQAHDADPFAAIAEPHDASPTPSVWETMKNNFNANTSGPKPGDTGIKAEVEKFGQGGGNVIRSLAHPIKAAEGFVKSIEPDPGAAGVAETLLGPAGPFLKHNIEGMSKGLAKNPSETLGELGTGMLVGELGGEAASGIGRVTKDTVGAKVAPVLTRTSDEMMANLIGANKRGALGPKVTFKQASDIGKTVNDAIKGGTSLREIAGQINDAKSTLTADTEKMLSAVPEDTTVEVAPLFSKNANKAIEGTLNEPSHKAIMKLMSELESQYPNQIGVQDALTLRRDLLRETDAAGTRKWPAGTKSYRTELYHDLNRELESTLPPDQAKIFRENNRKVTNLIKADRALDKKRLYGVGDLGKVHSTIGAAARVATGGTPGRMAAIKGLKLAGDKLGSTPTVTPATPKLYGVAGALTPNQTKDQF